MGIRKAKYPILDFDDDPSAVILPHHDQARLHLPQRAVFAFLGDRVAAYAKEVGARKVGSFESATKDFEVFVIDHKGTELCLCQAPVGASAATQLLDWLIGHGVSGVISGGSCGALTELSEGQFLIPSRALRDEGTSYHYLPPSKFVTLDRAARRAIKEAMCQHGRVVRDVVSWTTDGFFRETRAMIEYRKSVGCEVVEMECASLAACARARGALFGMLLYTADSLVGETHDPRDWGRCAADVALPILLDAAALISIDKINIKGDHI